MGKVVKRFVIFVVICSTIYLYQWLTFKSEHPNFESSYLSLSEWDASKGCLEFIELYVEVQSGLKKSKWFPTLVQGDLANYEKQCQQYFNKGINWLFILPNEKLKKDIQFVISLDEVNRCDEFLKESRNITKALERHSAQRDFVSYLKRKRRLCFNDYSKRLESSDFSHLYEKFRQLDTQNCQLIVLVGEELLEHYRRTRHDASSLEFEYMIPIYHTLSACYSEIWQHHKAKKLLLELKDYTGDNNYLAKLQKEERSIQRVQQERHFYSEYFVSKKIGAANQFTGHTVMAMIYVDLKGFEWGKLDRLQAEESLQVVQQWYQKEAARNDVVPPYFSVKSFQLNQDIMIDTYFKLASVEMSKLKRKDHQALAGLIVQKLGFKTPKALSESIKKQLNAEQVMLYFNFKKRARSFASRCYNNKERTWSRGDIVVKREAYSTCEGEYTFIFENPKKQRWQSYHFTMAHEGLHLFGADDLYNIQQAKEYATEDVMNYYMKFLEYNTIEDLTAYSIGWKKNAPQTPFPLNEIGN